MRFPNLEKPMSRRGFTLVELLVVVTIIVVLLAMLVPALSKAVYQAQLAQCAAGLRATGTGVIEYASANRRFYPLSGVQQVQQKDPGYEFSYIAPTALT